LASAASGASAQTANAAAAQPGADVEVRLSLAGDRAVYRAGEPVRLVLSFKTAARGYSLNTTTTKPASPVDEVILSTDAGVTRWLDDYSAEYRYAPDYMAMAELSPEPTRVELVLNDWVRFDRPGRYGVRVKTARVMRPDASGDWGRLGPLLTNEVVFEVAPMSAAEEEREVKRLSALLDSAKGREERARLSEELSYLSGEPSTREKVRRFLAPAGDSGNYTEGLTFGLLMARDRALAVRLLEAALRDTGRPATTQLLSMLTQLRVLLDAPAPDAPAPPTAGPTTEAPTERRRLAERVQQEYLRELAASLPRRAGENRRATAMTVMLGLPNEAGQAASPLLAPVREILLGEFDSLHPYDREYLLRVRWEQLRDPSLAPALERILARERSPQDYQLRTAALTRLLELDRQRARPFVVAELRDVNSFVDFDALTTLDDETLPEADDALLAQVRSLASGGANADFTRLRQRALLAARFASPAAYDGLMEAYREWGAKWPADVRGALLGYFARYNEAQAAPLVGQALEETPPGQEQSLLVELTRSNYNDSVDALLRARLEGAEPGAVGTAAYLMALHGPAADRAPIEARLARWRGEWGVRAAELDAEGADVTLAVQRMVEVNLMEALLTGKSWKLSDEEAARLKRGCATQECRRRYPAK
jgi:hypothetical protein